MDELGIPTYEEYKNGVKFDIEKGRNMKLNYNKGEAEKATSVTRKPGIYPFAVTDAQMKTAKTGTEGIAVTLELEIATDKFMKAFDNLWLSDKALFRLKNLCDSAKVPLPDDSDDLIGATGKVKVKVNDDGFFEVVNYITEVKTESQHYADTSGTDGW